MSENLKKIEQNLNKKNLSDDFKKSLEQKKDSLVKNKIVKK